MNNTRILVVDDDLIVMGLIQANLEARGYEVVTANNGTDSIRVAQKENPDLIILDIMMPEIDGFEACRKIREFSNAPVVMYSGRIGERDKEKCADCGANDYLTKPFVLRELLDKINALLEKKSPGNSE
jgi:DNA-binding response OmpR family regulator